MVPADQTLLAPLHDRIGLGMQRNSLAGRCDNLESFQHRAGRRRGNLAERIAHIELETDDAAAHQFGNMRDRVVAEQSVETEIDASLARRDFMLGGKRLRIPRWRNGVRHVEDGGDAAEGGGCRSARPIFLVGITRIAEMDVDIDGARQNMQTGGVKSLQSRRHRFVSADR
jgi:hypothetical protein